MSEERVGLVDHFRRAFEHAESAVRCYIALAFAKTEARRRQLVRTAAWTMGLAILAFIGILFIFSGLVRFVDSLDVLVPGFGRMCVGVGLLVVVGLVCLLRSRSKGG